MVLVVDPGRKSPYGIHVDSPLQRQWISFELIGSIRRIASIVRGAPGLPAGAKVEVADLDLERGHARRIAVADAAPRPTISTHVLDTERGMPAAGVRVDALAARRRQRRRSG